MSEWEVRPKSEVPIDGRARPLGLAAAIRALAANEAVFIRVRKDETITHLRDRIAGSLRGVHVRMDREKDGLWVFKDGDKP